MENHEKLSVTCSQFAEMSTTIFKECLDQNLFSDVTLVSEDDKQFLAHKVILSGFSSFFKRILHKNPHPHPLLYLKGINQTDLQALLNFIYTGESEVAYDTIDQFFKFATQFEIVGVPIIRPEFKENDTNISVDTVEDRAKTINEKQIDNQSIDKDIENIIDGNPVTRKQEVMENSIETTAESVLETPAFKDIFPYGVIEEGTRSKKKRKVIFFCDQCDYKTNQSGNLRKHTDGVHLGIIFSCNYCEKTYTANDSLQFHIRAQHFGVRQICKFCGFKFTQAVHLRRHLSKQHGHISNTVAKMTTMTASFMD